MYLVCTSFLEEYQNDLGALVGKLWTAITFNHFVLTWTDSDRRRES